MQITELLNETVTAGASDLHIITGLSPIIRVNGELSLMPVEALDTVTVDSYVKAVLTEEQIQVFRTRKELDFAYAIHDIGRFRGNVMYQKNNISLSFRVILSEVPSLEELRLPSELKRLCVLSQGLVLVTGPTGSGKSTTLAAMLDLINNERCENIVTIEDPIEFVHTHKKSIIRQREVGEDTLSFSEALRHVLRQDPDVILIGEMRDAESIAIALTAAETGHLVFSTLHTRTAPATISRIVDVFNDSRKDQIRQQLSSSLQGVISQQLVPGLGGERVVAVEYMAGIPAIQNLIREGKDHQLYGVIQTGQSNGMQTMEQALAKLYRKGMITKDTALDYATDKRIIEKYLTRGIQGG
jgi:twitching motility protein PilT